MPPVQMWESPVVGVVYSSTKKRPSRKRPIPFAIKTETSSDPPSSVPERVADIRLSVSQNMKTTVARRTSSRRGARVMAMNLGEEPDAASGPSALGTSSSSRPYADSTSQLALLPMRAFPCDTTPTTELLFSSGARDLVDKCLQRTRLELGGGLGSGFAKEVAKVNFDMDIFAVGPRANFTAAAALGVSEKGGLDGRATTVALLHAAAAHDHLEMVRELLKRGASVDLRDSLGGTALMTAAYYGHLSIVLLLQHSANPDLQSSDNRNALMMAAQQGHEACVQALLRAKANTELVDDDGHTALQWAEHEGHTATATPPSCSSSCSTRPTLTCSATAATPP